MRLNGEAVLTKEGIRLKSKDSAYLRALGVGDGTTCWGLWLDTRDRRHFYSRGNGDESGRLHPDERQFPHLIISPLHPSRWTSAFRLEAFLDRSCHKEGEGVRGSKEPLAATARFLKELNDVLGVNSIRTEGGIAGYDLFVMNALCEIPNLRLSMGSIEDGFVANAREIPRAARSVRPLTKEDAAKLQELRRDLLRAIGERMLPVLTRLHARVSLDNRQDGAAVDERQFLHDRLAREGMTPWFLAARELRDLIERADNLCAAAAKRGSERPFWSVMESYFSGLKAELDRPQHDRAWISDEVEEASNHFAAGDFALRRIESLLRSHGMQAVHARALVSLAYLRVWSFPGRAPVRFRFDKDWGGLRGNTAPITSFLNRFVVPADGTGFDRDQEHQAITAFHLHDGYMRVRFVRDWFARNRMRVVTIEFSTKFGRGRIDSRGVLRSAMELLSGPKFRLRVERIVTRPNRNDADSESGRIRILVKAIDGRGERDGRIEWNQVRRAMQTSFRWKLRRHGIVPRVRVDAWPIREAQSSASR